MFKIIKTFVITLFLISYINGTIYSQIQQPISKTYKLKYRHTEDFIPLIKALLSKKGNLQESKDMNIIIVNDLPLNIAQIDSLISKNDRPLKQVLVTIQLYLCSKINNNPVPPEFSDIKKLTDGFYDFNTFEKIDRCMINAQENSSTSFNFAGETYSASFMLDYISENERIVNFRNFKLTEVDKDIRGKLEKTIFETSSKIPNGTQIILSASKYKNTNKTLIVIVGVQII